MSHKPPPSLQELALNQCIKHSSQIVDLGNTPYRIVKPLLARFTVDQLIAIEAKCPKLAEQDDELWSEHISRVFKDRKLPRSNFRETYFAYCRDKEAQLGAARERLKLKQEQYNEHKKATSIVALADVPVHARHMGQNNIPFRSRGMQSVARRMQFNSQLRRPQRPPMLGQHDTATSPPRPMGQGSSAPTSPLGSPPLAKSPPASNWRRAGSPPAASHHYVTSPIKRTVPIPAGLPAKRKRVSSVFMPRK